MEEQILTAEQVAKILQVHPFTVLKFIKKGKLKAAKLGRVYRIRKKDLDEFIDSLVESAESKKEKNPHTNKKANQKKEKKIIIEESPEKSEETIYGDDHYVIELTEE
jgi:excisionase family DNA binding protein